MKWKKKGQLTANAFAVIALLIIIIGSAESMYFKEYRTIKSTRYVNDYYQTVHLDKITEDTKHIFGESSLFYSLMYTSQNLSMHGGINPALLEDKDGDGFSDNDLKIKVQKDGEEFIPYWTVVEGSSINKKIPDKVYGEEFIESTNDLLSFYLNKFQDNIAEYTMGEGIIHVRVGEPKAKFLEGEDGFVKGEFVSENGIIVELKSGDELISKLVSDGYVENRVKIRYWKLYDDGVNFVDDIDSLNSKIYEKLINYPDHETGGGGCGDSCKSPFGGTSEQTAENDVENILSEVLNEYSSRSEFKWELSLDKELTTFSSIPYDKSIHNTCEKCETYCSGEGEDAECTESCWTEPQCSWHYDRKYTIKPIIKVTITDEKYKVLNKEGEWVSLRFTFYMETYVEDNECDGHSCSG